MEDDKYNTTFFFEEQPRIHFYLITEHENVVFRTADGERVFTLKESEVKKVVAILQRWLGYGG